MRASGRFVGPRGVTLLLVTGIAGAILAVHGWSGRQSAEVSAGLGPRSSATPRSSSPPGPTTSASQGRPPVASGNGGGSPGSAAAKPGPLLNSQSFAGYSFLVWPGTPSSAAKSAMAGLAIAVRPTSSGISLKAGVSGQPQGAARLYRGGARVYVVEASMGDEAGNTDYNLGDDGVVVTDARGRIVQ
jgi:hypothetical protein